MFDWIEKALTVTQLELLELYIRLRETFPDIQWTCIIYLCKKWESEGELQYGEGVCNRQILTRCSNVYAAMHSRFTSRQQQG